MSPAGTLLRILKNKNICFSIALSWLPNWFLEINNNNAKTPSSLIISRFSFILPLNSQLLCKVTGCCMKTVLYALTQAPSIYSIENDDTNNSNACLVFGRCHSHMTHYSKSKQQEWYDVLKEKTGHFLPLMLIKQLIFRYPLISSRNFTLSQISLLTCLVTNDSWKVGSCEYSNCCGGAGGEELASKVSAWLADSRQDPEVLKYCLPKPTQLGFLAGTPQKEERTRNYILLALKHAKLTEYVSTLCSEMFQHL